MMDAQDLKNALAEYSGSETFTRVSPLFPNFVATEGVVFLAENAGAFWLLDMIASHLPAVKAAEETFAVVLLERDAEGSGAVFKLVDDVPESVVYAEQVIEYTDFPLSEIKLYIGFDGEYFTVMLPGEY